MTEAISLEPILDINPYNAAGYGLALAILIWQNLYFRSQIKDKDGTIKYLNSKLHEMISATLEKMGEYKIQSSIDKNEVMTTFDSFRTMLQRMISMLENSRSNENIYRKDQKETEGYT
jgi:hypothetical protein